jgi:hypothetical protein
MEAADLSELIRYSRYKLDRLKRLSELTQRQRTAIAQQDIEMLNKLVALKQQVIDDIDRYDSSFEQQLKRLGAQFGTTGLTITGLAERADACGSGGVLPGIVCEIMEQIEVIRRIEEQNHQRLLKAMERAEADLRKIKDGRRGLRGYRNLERSPYGSFIDSKK